MRSRIANAFNAWLRREYIGCDYIPISLTFEGPRTYDRRWVGFVKFPRKLVSALLLVGFSLSLAAPLAALSSSLARMACCKTGHSCCHRTHTGQQAGSGWKANAECPNQCGFAATAPFQGHFVPPAFSMSGASLPAVLAKAQAEPAGATSGAYLAFLYQLPPPALS